MGFCDYWDGAFVGFVGVGWSADCDWMWYVVATIVLFVVYVFCGLELRLVR